MMAFATLCLAFSIIAQAVHLHWVFRQHQKLGRRVHHLEMAQDHADYWRENQEQIWRDRWER